MRWITCSRLREMHPPPTEFSIPEGGIPGLLDNEPVIVSAILERTVVYGPIGDKQLARLHRVMVLRTDVKPHLSINDSQLRRKQAATGRAKARIARAKNKAARLATAAA